MSGSRSSRSQSASQSGSVPGQTHAVRRQSYNWDSDDEDEADRSQIFRPETHAHMMMPGHVMPVHVHAVHARAAGSASGSGSGSPSRGSPHKVSPTRSHSQPRFPDPGSRLGHRSSSSSLTRLASPTRHSDTGIQSSLQMRHAPWTPPGTEPFVPSNSFAPPPTDFTPDVGGPASTRTPENMAAGEDGGGSAAMLLEEDSPQHAHFGASAFGTPERPERASFLAAWPDCSSSVVGHPKLVLGAL